MKKVGKKFLFVVNILIASLLVFSYAAPYISPREFPILSLFSLTVPVWICLNLFFFIFWLLLPNRNFLLSLLSLLLGLPHVGSFVQVRIPKSKTENHKKDIRILTYNVHSFNRFHWIDSDTIPEQISNLILQKDPDIFCAQEYYDCPTVNFDQFPYKYQDYNNQNKELALVIFSKNKIINKGSLAFRDTANNIIFADIVVQKDTIRVYNVHFQSHKISSKAEQLINQNSGQLIDRFVYSFDKQQYQAEKLLKHLRQSPYRNMVVGDFNNTSYSYIFNQVRAHGLKDAFKERGSGFGITFNFDFFPVRIDFILIPKSFKVIHFSSLKHRYSDHYPICADLLL